MANELKRFIREELGPEMIEWAVVTLIILLAAILILSVSHNTLTDMYRSTFALLNSDTLVIKIEDAEAAARATEGRIAVVPISGKGEMLAYRESLGIPINFLPAARNLAFLGIGKFKIDGPSIMTVGETAIFDATITLDQNLVKQADSTSFISTAPEGIRFSKVLYAKLDGVDFEIRPSEDDTQPQMALLGNETRWSWQVQATRRGQQKPLTVRLFAAAIDEIEGSERLILLVPSETKYVDVTQPIPAHVGGSEFTQKLVLALVGGSSVLAAAVTAWLTHYLDRKRFEDRLKNLEKELKELRGTHGRSENPC